MRSGAGALVFPQFRDESRLFNSRASTTKTTRVGLSVRSHGESNRDRAELVALQRLGTVEDCPKVVEFLATDLCDYVTGAVIPIDGGLVRG
jgi:NAD(P)-dependent dehydrogenase (short-subunit alcohol dehydrogenase family)